MDWLDLTILHALQADGRKASSELAREQGVAPSTVLERIRRLEQRGVIRGYRADLDPRAVGIGIEAFVALEVRADQADSIQRFERAMRDIPQVVSCRAVAGRFDYLLRVAADDVDHLRKLLYSDFGVMGSISKNETFLILSNVKEAGLPLPPVE